MINTNSLLSLIGLISGLPVGIVFGILIERREFCSATAVTRSLFFRDNLYFKIIFVAIAIEILFFFLFSISECVPCLPGNFSIILTPVGGLLFGTGMILGSGCASGTCYKIGEGNGQAVIVLVTFGLTGYLLTRSSRVTAILAGFREQDNPTLPGITGIPDLLFALIVLIALVVFIEVEFWQKREKLMNLPLNELLKGWKASWWMTATILGLLGVIAFLLSSTTGRESGLSISSGIINDIGGLIDVLLGKDAVFGWGGMFVIGTIAGAFLSSKQSHHFKLAKPRRATALRATIGGILMGTGSVMTGNCNVGHLFNGLPVFSVSSITALIFIYLGSILTLKALEL